MMGQALVSKKLKGVNGKIARNANQVLSKAKTGGAVGGAGKAPSQYYGEDDDDFEDKYIVSGPSAPVKFKSGPPAA